MLLPQEVSAGRDEEDHPNARLRPVSWTPGPPQRERQRGILQLHTYSPPLKPEDGGSAKRSSDDQHEALFLGADYW